MQKKGPTPRNARIVSIVMIGMALFVFFDPFGWLTPQGDLRPRVSQEDAAAYGSYMAESARPADEYLRSAVENHQITYLSELGAIGDEPAYLAAQLPQLVEQAGLNTLGLYFLLAADQPQIDRLMASSSFDADLANRLLFNRLVIWGYREYRDILEAAWRIEQQSPGALRVLGLNVQQDFSQLTEDSDIEDPQKVRTILANGIPDRVMAETLTSFLQQNSGARVLAFISREQGFPDLDLPYYTAQLAGLGYENENSFARLVHMAGYTDDASLTFHSLWPSNETANRSDYPGSGSIDAGLDSWEAAEGELPLPVGFDIAGPLESVVIQRSFYNYGFSGEGDDVLYFGRLFDGYIVLKRLPDLLMATPIDGFITEENLAAAAENFPGPRPQNPTVEGFTDYILGYAETRMEILKNMD